MATTVGTPSLVSLQVGMPAYIAHGSKEVLSGIFKQSTEAPCRISVTGVEGDGQGDTVHHGGPDKAVCAYFAERYPYWEERLGKNFPFGSFGENFTISAWTENDLCIGDTVSVGETVLQVSQPRQPCFKLGLRNDLPELQALVQQTGYTGFYFRVVKEGAVRAGDSFVRTVRHPAAFSIAEANEVMYRKKDDAGAIASLLAVDELALSWREQLQSRLAKLERR